MSNPDGLIQGLSECVDEAIHAYFEKANFEWSAVDNAAPPILRIEAFFEERGNVTPESSRTEKIVSRTLDLATYIASPRSQDSTVDANVPVEIPENCPGQDVADSRTIQRRNSVEDNVANGDSEDENEGTRRKGVGGLRISQPQAIQEDASEHQRRMQSDIRSFPKRRKIVSEGFVFQESTLDKLILGIWEQIHGSLNLDPRAILDQLQVVPVNGSDLDTRLQTVSDSSFSRINAFCRKVTQASRVCRSLEIIIQARWVELFEEQVQHRMETSPDLSVTKHRKAVFMDACQDFGWSEKELRNKMAVWRGYKELKDAAGWACLVFAGMGIYRFCKYRVGFDKDSMRRLQSLRSRLEVAADTLHPNWRQLLSVVGELSKPQYTGHPHNWVVFEDGSEPLPLRSTYVHYDPHFDYEHIEEPLIDEGVWGCDDPRWTPQQNAVTRMSESFSCAACGEQQSDDAKSNSCYCFPTLFGCVKRSPPPIQVYRTPDGRNNGVVALTPFERGAAIGEFVGLITKGVRHLDVMDCATATASYQIWQGRQGNYTRFINHSCKANAQYQQFNWLDTQRVVLVSKGIAAGSEITVDYSDRYWGGLDKACLCGESCCRYKRDK